MTKVKHTDCFFAVFSTILAIYSIMLLHDSSFVGGVAGQTSPDLPSTSGSVYPSLSLFDIEIVYPIDDLTTNPGDSLEISGVSHYDPRYICHVSVIVNDVKPYQKTTPTGGNVAIDYSTWKYVIDPSYTTIEEGDNRITARLLCADESGEDIRKWNSITVIGHTDTGLNNQTLLEGEAMEVSSAVGMPALTTHIDKDTLIELVNNRIGNKSDIVRESIRDSMLPLYAG